MKIDTHKDKPSEVAKAFGISEATLCRWAKDPAFPQPVRYRAYVRYDLEAIKHFLSQERA